MGNDREEVGRIFKLIGRKKKEYLITQVLPSTLYPSAQTWLSKVPSVLPLEKREQIVT